MNKYFKFLLSFIFIGLTFFSICDAVVHVNGYYRSNGTYVAPHYRSSPNSTPTDNFSYPGNTNPYTGKTATGNVDTYLKNYDSYSPSTTYSTSKNYDDCSDHANSFYNYSNRRCECVNGYAPDLKTPFNCFPLNTWCTMEIDTNAINKVGVYIDGTSVTDICKCNDGYELKTNPLKCEKTDKSKAELVIKILQKIIILQTQLNDIIKNKVN